MLVFSKWIQVHPILLSKSECLDGTEEKHIFFSRDTIDQAFTTLSKRDYNISSVCHGRDIVRTLLSSQCTLFLYRAASHISFSVSIDFSFFYLVVWNGFIRG